MGARRCSTAPTTTSAACAGSTGGSCRGCSTRWRRRAGSAGPASGCRRSWGHRPLTREQLTYAALDTHFLLPIYDALATELGTRGALEEARREFDRISRGEARERVFDPEGWRRLKGARELDAPGKAVLRSLWIAREERARADDRPPFKVLAEQAMLELARRRPGDDQALAAVPGVTPSVLRRMGPALRVAIEAARVAG